MSISDMDNGIFIEPLDGYMLVVDLSGKVVKISKKRIAKEESKRVAHPVIEHKEK